MQNKAPAHPARSISSLFANHAPAWLACIIVLIVDQLTKRIVLASMQPGESIPLLKNALHFTSVQNTGIAFGLFQGGNMAFILLSGAVIAFVIGVLASVKQEEKLLQACLGMLLGGALGNLLDRIFLGYVVDFLDFRVWPVFNVADSAITVSVILLIFLLWKK